MYFKFSELQDWGKRSSEGCRRIVRYCPYCICMRLENQRKIVNKNNRLFAAKFCLSCRFSCMKQEITDLIVPYHAIKCAAEKKEGQTA